MLRKLFGLKKEEVTDGYRHSVMRNIMFCMHDYIKENVGGWHIELVMERRNAYRDLIRKPKGKIPL